MESQQFFLIFTIFFNKNFSAQTVDIIDFFGGRGSVEKIFEKSSGLFGVFSVIQWYRRRSGISEIRLLSLKNGVPKGASFYYGGEYAEETWLKTGI